MKMSSVICAASDKDKGVILSMIEFEMMNFSMVESWMAWGWMKKMVE